MRRRPLREKYDTWYILKNIFLCYCTKLNVLGRLAPDLPSTILLLFAMISRMHTPCLLASLSFRYSDMWSRRRSDHPSQTVGPALQQQLNVVVPPYIRRPYYHWDSRNPFTGPPCVYRLVLRLSVLSAVLPIHRHRLSCLLCAIVRPLAQDDCSSYQVSVPAATSETLQNCCQGSSMK